MYGNLASIQSSTTNGTKLTYAYDSLNRITSVADRFANSTAYSFDSVGNLQTMRYPNAVTNTWAYNTLNRLTNINVTTASGTIASFAYKLAAAGNRTNRTSTVSGITNQAFTYNANDHTEQGL